MSSKIIFSPQKKTKLVSKIISEKTGAEMVEIRSLDKKEGFFNELFKNFSYKELTPNDIRPSKIDFTDDDLIIIGSPPFHGKISPSILAFIKNNDFKNKNVIIFTTTSNKEAYRILKVMKQNIERSKGEVINSFFMKTSNKTDDEILISTVKLVKQLDLDLYI